MRFIEDEMLRLGIEMEKNWLIVGKDLENDGLAVNFIARQELINSIDERYNGYGLRDYVRPAGERLISALFGAILVPWVALILSAVAMAILLACKQIGN